MPQPHARMTVRLVNEIASIIDIQGDLNAFSEPVLMHAYARASSLTTYIFILNFSAMEYMNSGGIGLIVTLLIRMNRQKQQLYAFGLSDHYKHIFELTRLNDAIKMYDTEPELLAALSLVPTWLRSERKE